MDPYSEDRSEELKCHIGIDAAYEKLAAKIVRQAAVDYRHALLHPEKYTNQCTMADCRTFFRSEWFEQLTGRDGPRMARILERGVPEFVEGCKTRFENKDRASWICPICKGEVIGKFLQNGTKYRGKCKQCLIAYTVKEEKAHEDDKTNTHDSDSDI